MTRVSDDMRLGPFFICTQFAYKVG